MTSYWKKQQPRQQGFGAPPLPGFQQTAGHSSFSSRRGHCIISTAATVGAAAKYAPPGSFGRQPHQVVLIQKPQAAKKPKVKVDLPPSNNFNNSSRGLSMGNSIPSPSPQLNKSFIFWTRNCGSTFATKRERDVLEGKDLWDTADKSNNHQNSRGIDGSGSPRSLFNE